MELNTPQDYIEMALRRKWCIIIPFVVCIGLSFGVYKKLPKIYKAETLILVVPQEVPEDYIKPTVKSSISDRLSTLKQQILSRTRLESVIREFRLYSDKIGKLTMEEIVELMRKGIEIKVRRVRGPDTFTISYQGRDPSKVMMVTNRLASLFIEENLRAREQVATGTSDFLRKELFSIETALKDKEQDIRTFKERHMGELPEQLNANLRILGRLQDQVKDTYDALKTAEERRFMLQRELSQLSERESAASDAVGSEVVVENQLVTQLNQLITKLNELRSIYTDKHPDVIDTRAQIARLEKDIAQQIAEQEAPNKGTNPHIRPLVENPMAAQLKREFREIKLEIGRLKVERESLKKQIAMYQRRVENTPRTEQELATLLRDYDLLKDNYKSLLNKQIQSKLAENLERRQKGEQFKILDPARMPEKPFKPNPQKVMLVGAFLGLLLGGGLGYMKETVDRSFHKIEEIEEFLELPVIAAIPLIRTEGTEKN